MHTLRDLYPADSTRLSIPVHGRKRGFSDEELHRYSFDLSIFPLYLARRVAPRVRIIFSERPLQDPALLGWYANADGSEQQKVAFLRADPSSEAGIATDSDDFYYAVHAAFAAQAGQGDNASTYLGFTRHGSPPYAPLFALALLYQKFGRGLFKAGELLPTPWPALTSGYAMRA